MTSGGAVPAVLETERCLVTKPAASVLRWRVQSIGRLAGAAWVEYEETRRGAVAFVASGSHPAMRESGAVAALVERVAALHPRSHAWYLARDLVERDTQAAVTAAATLRGIPLRRI